MYEVVCTSTKHIKVGKHMVCVHLYVLTQARLLHCLF